MPASRDSNTLIRTYLRSRYNVVNADVTTPDLTSLVTRYLAENPDALNDQTKVFQALKVAAEA